MFNKKIKSAAIILLFGSLSAIVNAGLTIHADFINPEEIKKNGDLNFGFSQSGLSIGDYASVVGEAVDMPLSIAMDIIVPNDSWDVKISHGAENYLVSWVGTGRPWPEVLKLMAKGNELLIDVDWDKKEIDIVAVGYEKEKMKNLQREFMVAQTLNKKDGAVDTLKNKMDAIEIKSASVDKDKVVYVNDASDVFVESENKRHKELMAEYKASPVLYGDGTFEEFIESYGKKLLSYDRLTYKINPRLTLRENIKSWIGVIHNWGMVDETAQRSSFRFDYEIKLKGDLIGVTRKLISKYKDSSSPLDIKYYAQEGQTQILVLKDLEFKE
jgi:hypothetical protein